MAKYKIIPSSRTIVQSPISIGHKAEKGVEAIEFDLTAWVETYGSGTLTVIMRRWGDAIPYPIALEIDENNKATWTLSDTDTAKAGMAYAQLNYIVGDDVVKKSDIYTFRVMDSLVGEGDPPEAYESWLEHLTHFAAEAMAEVLDIEGIVTDKTLTVDGGIADGKATGDALALKADKSTTYTKAEVDQMIEDVEIETDTTLAISGAPADAAETGRQLGLIKADLNNYNVYDVLKASATYTSRELNGVTFTWNSEHTECTANGTADGGKAYVNIYNNSSAMPDGINPGSKYNVTFTTTDVEFALVFGLYDTLGSYIDGKVFRSDGVLKIPDGCGGMYIRLFVDNGRSVTNAVASNIALLNAGTNYQLSQDVAQIYGIETGYDVLTIYGNFTDRTFRGVTFTWSGRQCHVSGTADGGDAYCNIYYGLLPDGMMPGDLYRIRYESTTVRIGVHWYFYDGSGTLISDAAGSSDMEMRVPVGASMWLIKIYVINGVTIDGYLTRIQVVKMKPLEMDIPLIVSFVDDDTTRDELVTKFHDACCHNGVKGNYAVITKKVEDGNTSASKLVAYEDEGFGMLIHCYQQYYPSDSPWIPEGGVRTEAQTNACRANLAKGIRQMIDMGLLNYDYWITPGGHMEPDLIDVAKQLSLKCLISTNNGRENNMTDYDKYFIKRVSFGATDTFAASSMSGIKELIDKVASRGKGWFIITTHFNDGWSDLTWDDTLDANGYPIGYARFNEMVQYAISKGMVPMSVPQAWQYYEPILNANRVECNEANA